MSDKMSENKTKIKHHRKWHDCHGQKLNMELVLAIIIIIGVNLIYYKDTIFSFLNKIC